ncbi:hypothetical protein P4O66_016029 [Electrophorus voltai]|uniref:Apoptosis antagonizing transcription factor n=1 Tax=Electrophorus voltai TaxID=2609070 RepID=A0AAD9DNP9_9TELE|nr:hypothetical protein P4O66_016029 [Electrophorus voltai]
MSASISQQLSDLLNPLPNFVDPEDDQDEETKARVIDRFDEDDEEEDLPCAGLRKRTTALLEDTDTRYRGQRTSRRDLRKEMDASSEEDDEGDEEEDINNGDVNKDVEDEEEDEGDDNSGEEEEDLNSDDISQISHSVSKMKASDMILPKVTDFHKLTEGMDDLGESEDEENGDTDEEGDSEEGSEEENGAEGEVDEDDSGALMTFSKEKVDEEVKKGEAVRNQLALWDLLLEGRIKMQKALLIANQLPQPDTFPEFKSKGGPEYAGALQNSHKALKALQRSLLELQDLLLYQSPDTRGIAQGKNWPGHRKAKDDEEVNSSDEPIEDDDGQDTAAAPSGPPKRKLDVAEYPDFMAKRFAAFQPYCDDTLQKWYDKTRLTTGKAKAADLALKANVHLKDLDEEIFDDDDFYHQLLRELIERKTSAADPNDQVAMGRQWLAIQKLRSKIKKKVDTKASKGRKVRFHIHSKLVNFMAPMDHSSMGDEARACLSANPNPLSNRAEANQTPSPSL